MRNGMGHPPAAFSPSYLNGAAHSQGNLSRSWREGGPLTIHLPLSAKPGCGPYVLYNVLRGLSSLTPIAPCSARS